MIQKLAGKFTEQCQDFAGETNEKRKRKGIISRLYSQISTVEFSLLSVTIIGHNDF